MNIGIIGSGNIGSALAKQWAKAGHSILLGSRDVAKANELAAQISAARRPPQGGTYQEAVDFGSVVVLATPFDAAQEILTSLSGLSGKVLLETTNAFGGADPRSSLERIAEWAGGARVVKAYNTVFVQVIGAAPAERLFAPSVFMAGDDAEAKDTVASLITDTGLEPFDVGGASAGKHLDNLAAFIIEMGYGRGMGPQLGYRVTRALP